MPLRIVELMLEIVKLAMEGQDIEQRQRMWAWYIEDVEKWRAFWAKIPPP